VATRHAGDARTRPALNSLVEHVGVHELLLAPEARGVGHHGQSREPQAGPEPHRHMIRREDLRRTLGSNPMMAARD
jgi:hypothetical protein